MTIKNSPGLLGRWILWEEQTYTHQAKVQAEYLTHSGRLGKDRSNLLLLCIMFPVINSPSWLLHHLNKTAECLLSGLHWFLVHFKCHCCFLVFFSFLWMFLFILLHGLSWPPSIPHFPPHSWPLQPEVMPLTFSGGTTMNSFLTNLVSWFGKHPLPTISVRQCELKLLSFSRKRLFCNWNTAHIS